MTTWRPSSKVGASRHLPCAAATLMVGLAVVGFVGLYAATVLAVSMSLRAQWPRFGSPAGALAGWMVRDGLEYIPISALRTLLGQP
jgi:hypothetical protein